MYKSQQGSNKPSFKSSYRPPTRAPFQKRTLLSAKHINPENISKLFVTIGSRDIDQIKNFIPENNKNLNLKNENGETVLHVLLDQETALDSDNEDLLYDIITYLISQGVSVSGFNKYNITPLHLAAKLQYYKIVELLIKHGAEPNAKDSQDMTPLHYAVQGILGQCKKKETVRPLIPKPEKPESTDFDKLTNLIFEILKEPRFRETLTTDIKGTVVNQITDTFDNDKKNATNTKITNILSNKDSIKIKRSKIVDLMQKLSKDLVNDFEQTFQKTFKKLSIEPNQVDGWTPIQNPTNNQKILEKKDDVIGNGRDHAIYNKKYEIVQDIMNIFNDTGFTKAGNNLITNADTLEKLELTEGTVKHDLVKSLIINATQEPTEPLNNDIKVRMFIIVGKIVDEIIISYVKKVLNNNSNKIIKNEILGEDVDIDDIELFGKDVGFESNYTQLTRRLNKQYTADKVDMTPKNVDNLQFSARLMQNSQESPTNQYPKYNENYTAQRKIEDLECYHFNEKIIDLLVTSGARVDQQSDTLSSPIYYAIDQKNETIVKKLIENGASSYNPKLVNNYNAMPIEYGINAYEQHLNTEYNTLLPKPFKGLYGPILANVEKEMKVKDEFGNNMIRYMDIIYPQILTMYNNVLFKYAKNYINQFTYEDLRNIGFILRTNGILTSDTVISLGIPLISNISESNETTILENNNTSGVLSDKKKEVDEKINMYQKEKTNDESTLDSVNKEIKEYQRRLDNFEIYKKNYSEEQRNAFKKKLDDKIAILESKKITLNENIEDSDDNIVKYNNKQQNINTNYNEISDIIKEDLKQQIKAYENTMDSNLSVSELYDDLFENVFKTNEDHMMYNELWRLYLNDDKRMQNLTNIHLITVILQQKMLGRIKNTISTLKDNISGSSQQMRDRFETIKKEFMSINKLHESIFNETIKDYDELPLEYNKQTNYVRKEIMDIYAHVLKHVVLSNFYLAIGNSIANNIEQRTNNDDKSKSIEQARKIMESSKNYIIDELPLILVKHYMQVYENDEDKDRDIKSFASLMEPIYRNLKLNTMVKIDDDSTIIKNIQDKLVPYYQDIVRTTIDNMQYVIENYNRLIKNEGKHISILHSLINKAQSDIITLH